MANTPNLVVIQGTEEAGSKSVLQAVKHRHLSVNLALLGIEIPATVPPDTPVLSVTDIQTRRVSLSASAYSHPSAVAHGWSLWEVAGESGDFTNPVARVLTGPVTTAVVTGLVPGQLHVARVSYLDVEGVDSAWSEGVSFITLTDAGQAAEVVMAEPILVFGQGGGNAVYEAGRGFVDDGLAYHLRARSDRVAPAGIGGEATFDTVYLAISHTMAVDVVVVPVVDDVELDPITISLTAQTVRTLERFEIGLSIPLVNAVAQEVGRFAPRGCWFQLLVYDDGLAAGDLLIEQAEVEHEVVRESLVGVA